MNSIARIERRQSRGLSEQWQSQQLQLQQLLQQQLPQLWQVRMQLQLRVCCGNEVPPK